MNFPEAPEWDNNIFPGHENTSDIFGLESCFHVLVLHAIDKKKAAWNFQKADFKDFLTHSRIILLQSFCKDLVSSKIL
jgi:hypothetical protein